MDNTERDLAGYNARKSRKIGDKLGPDGRPRIPKHKYWVRGRKPGIFGRNLRAIRKSRGLSVCKLATLAHLTKKQIDEYECGQITDPRISSLIRLAIALDVPVGVLYGIEPHRQGEVYGRPDNDSSVDVGLDGLAGAGDDPKGRCVVVAQRNRQRSRYYGALLWCRND